MPKNKGFFEFLIWMSTQKALQEKSDMKKIFAL